MTVGFQKRDEFLHHLKTELCVLHFATPETQSHFHLHIFTEEIYRVPDLDPEIMRINAWAELDFFDGGRVLMLLGLYSVKEFGGLGSTLTNPISRGRRPRSATPNPL